MNAKSSDIFISKRNTQPSCGEINGKQVFKHQSQQLTCHLRSSVLELLHQM